jgi:hypothetical protein
MRIFSVEILLLAIIVLQEAVIIYLLWQNHKRERRLMEFLAELLSRSPRAW